MRSPSRSRRRFLVTRITRHEQRRAFVVRFVPLLLLRAKPLPSYFVVQDDRRRLASNVSLSAALSLAIPVRVILFASAARISCQSARIKWEAEAKRTCGSRADSNALAGFAKHT